MTIAEAIQETQERIATACINAGRTPDSVQLLLATKTQPVDRLKEALEAGCLLFGENRAQELVQKAPEFVGKNIQWQFIGQLQTNKIKDILKYASCVQSVDRIKVINELGKQVQTNPLNIMLEVNTSGEPDKAGCEPEQAVEMLELIKTYPLLQVVGFMTVGALSRNELFVRECFAKLRNIQEEAIRQQLVPHTATQLSMGMSSDMEWAIAEGSTMVRVGSAVFGSREE